MFARFRQHNLKVKPSKCHIGTGAITYLGYEISNKGGISPRKAKTEIIKNWPQPNTTKDIRAFLGLTSFFRRTIKIFSSISAELNKLVRKDSGYRAGPLPAPAARSFQALNHALFFLFFSGVPQRLDAGDLGRPTRYCYLESIYHAWDEGTDHRAYLVSHPTQCVAVLGGLH